ncbi:MAG: hypothetical protein II338_05725 [Bacteroidaceae bacterium]|nr:hypothetical protein [Bacteroidaceae bacterium]
MNFAMSDEEILRSFNTAAHPSKQVAILADLNATDVQTMCAKLKELGADYKKLPRQKKDKPETPTEKKSAPKHTSAPAWMTISNDLAKKQTAASARVGEIEEQLAALQDERRKLMDKICDIGTALDVLLAMYGEGRTDNG